MQYTVRYVPDNGGGVTLMVKRGKKEIYAHAYDTARYAARDLLEIVDGENDPADWEGNDPGAWFEYDADTERNGGYRWFSGTAESVALQLVRSNRGWGNIRESIFEIVPLFRE